MKQLQPDPWALAAENFKVGDRVRGTVARLTDFGAFINLAPGVDGLVHISEMSWSKKIRKPSDVVSVGDTLKWLFWASIRREANFPGSEAGAWRSLGRGRAEVPCRQHRRRPDHEHDQLRRVRRSRKRCRRHDPCRRHHSREALGASREVLQTGATVKAQVIEFDRSKRRIRLGMKQLEPTSTDHYMAEHQAGEALRVAWSR